MARCELEKEEEARFWEKWTRDVEEEQEEARRAVAAWVKTILEQFEGLDEGLKAVKMFLYQFDGHISPPLNAAPSRRCQIRADTRDECRNGGDL